MVRLVKYRENLNANPWESPGSMACTFPPCWRRLSREHRRMARSKDSTPELAVPVREVPLLRRMQETVLEISISNLLRISRVRQLSRPARVLVEGRPSLPVGVTA